MKDATLSFSFPSLVKITRQTPSLPLLIGVRPLLPFFKRDTHLHLLTGVRPLLLFFKRDRHLPFIKKEPPSLPLLQSKLPSLPLVKRGTPVILFVDRRRGTFPSLPFPSLFTQKKSFRSFLKKTISPLPSFYRETASRLLSDRKRPFPKKKGKGKPASIPFSFPSRF